MSVKITRETTGIAEQLYAALNTVNDKRVGKVGWFEGSNYVDENGRTTPVAEVAAQNEFGNPSLNIPPRATLRPTIAKRRTYWQKVAAKATKDVLEGKAPNFDHVLELMGLVAASDFGDAINQLSEPALRPATIDARIRKQKKGRILFGGINKPLIESGIMLKTLTSIVEDE